MLNMYPASCVYYSRLDGTDLFALNIVQDIDCQLHVLLDVSCIASRYFVIVML